MNVEQSIPENSVVNVENQSRQANGCVNVGQKTPEDSVVSVEVPEHNRK